MSALVASVARKVDDDCRANTCKKGNCSVSMNGAPAQRLIVDLDCATLPIQEDQKRCDYLFIGEQDNTAWVAPIELKGGSFKVKDVVEQLQGGSNVADSWLPFESPFQFVPVMAYGKGARKKDFSDLRGSKITLRGKKEKIKLIRCGAELVSKLK